MADLENSKRRWLFLKMSTKMFNIFVWRADAYKKQNYLIVRKQFL